MCKPLYLQNCLRYDVSCEWHLSENMLPRFLGFEMEQKAIERQQDGSSLSFKSRIMFHVYLRCEERDRRKRKIADRKRR